MLLEWYLWTVGHWRELKGPEEDLMPSCLLTSFFRMSQHPYTGAYGLTNQRQYEVFKVILVPLRTLKSWIDTLVY